MKIIDLKMYPDLDYSYLTIRILVFPYEGQTIDKNILAELICGYANFDNITQNCEGKLYIE